MTFTGSSQSNDSTYCFTHGQVQTFLKTRVELEKCVETNDRLSNDLIIIRDENASLIEKNEGLNADVIKFKRQRNRGIIFGTISGVLGILFTTLSFVK